MNVWDNKEGYSFAAVGREAFRSIKAVASKALETSDFAPSCAVTEFDHSGTPDFVRKGDIVEAHVADIRVAGMDYDGKASLYVDCKSNDLEHPEAFIRADFYPVAGSGEIEGEGAISFCVPTNFPEDFGGAGCEVGILKSLMEGLGCAIIQMNKTHPTLAQNFACLYEMSKDVHPYLRSRDGYLQFAYMFEKNIQEARAGKLKLNITIDSKESERSE